MSKAIGTGVAAESVVELRTDDDDDDGFNLHPFKAACRAEIIPQCWDAPTLIGFDGDDGGGELSRIEKMPKHRGQWWW